MWLTGWQQYLGMDDQNLMITCVQGLAVPVALGWILCLCGQFRQSKPERSPASWATFSDAVEECWWDHRGNQLYNPWNLIKFHFSIHMHATFVTVRGTIGHHCMPQVSQLFSWSPPLFPLPPAALAPWHQHRIRPHHGICSSCTWPGTGIQSVEEPGIIKRSTFAMCTGYGYPFSFHKLSLLRLCET